MSGWSVRGQGRVRDGLTIYQLQQLVRTGDVDANDEVSSDGTWKRVSEVSLLARHLPQPVAGASASTLVVGGIPLEVGPDGKPLPLPPDVVARLLRATSDAPRNERAKRIGRALLVFAGALLAVEAVVLVRAMMTPIGP